jgi:phosphatidate cytidylyltransferase
MINEFEKRLLSSLILVPIAVFFIIQGSVFFTFFLSILFLATSYEWIKMCKKNNLLKIIGITFLIFSFYVAYILREGENFKIFLFIVIICIFTDIGGYIFGKIFKGPKLTKISPKKTYAGVIGGFVLSLIAGLIFIHYFEKDLTKLNTEALPLLLMILFISFVSQLGDLIISFFKRKAKLKDTGKIIPGHGGLLDRIDGLIFVFPALFVLFSLIALIKS